MLYIKYFDHKDNDFNKNDIRKLNLNDQIID